VNRRLPLFLPPSVPYACGSLPPRRPPPTRVADKTSTGQDISHLRKHPEAHNDGDSSPPPPPHRSLRHADAISGACVRVADELIRSGWKERFWLIQDAPSGSCLRC